MTYGQAGAVCPQCGSAAAVHSVDELAAMARARLGQFGLGYQGPPQGYQQPPGYQAPPPGYQPPPGSGPPPPSSGFPSPSPSSGFPSAPLSSDFPAPPPPPPPPPDYSDSAPPPGYTGQRRPSRWSSGSSTSSSQSSSSSSRRLHRGRRGGPRHGRGHEVHRPRDRPPREARLRGAGGPRHGRPAGGHAARADRDRRTAPGPARLPDRPGDLPGRRQPRAAHVQPQPRAHPRAGRCHGGPADGTAEAQLPAWPVREKCVCGRSSSSPSR